MLQLTRELGNLELLKIYQDHLLMELKTTSSGLKLVAANMPLYSELEDQQVAPSILYICLLETYKVKCKMLYS